MSLLAAAANLPISYMTAIEGLAHTRFGLVGMLALDAVSTIVVGTTLLVVFHKVGAGRGDEMTETEPALAGGR
jgi:hypothetical protein